MCTAARHAAAKHRQVRKSHSAHHGGTAHDAGTGRRVGRDKAGETVTKAGAGSPAPPRPPRTLTAPRLAARLRCCAGGAGAARLPQCSRRLAAAGERNGPRPRPLCPPSDRLHAAARAAPASTTVVREIISAPAQQTAPTGSAASGPPPPRARARAISAGQIRSRQGQPLSTAVHTAVGNTSHERSGRLNNKVPKRLAQSIAKNWWRS